MKNKEKEINYKSFPEFVDIVAKQLPITTKPTWAKKIRRDDIQEILDPVITETKRGKEFHIPEKNIKILINKVKNREIIL